MLKDSFGKVVKVMIRSDDEIIRQAAIVKNKMLSRAKRIQQLVEHDIGIKSGKYRKPHPERYETMKCDLDDAISMQNYDKIILAVCRWVLGLTEEIDENNLELDK